MLDLDLAQATFEYIMRKKIKDGELPLNNTNITCDGRYYIVTWQGVEIQQLWDNLVDEEFLSGIEEDEHERLFTEILNVFIANLRIDDPANPDQHNILSDLDTWTSVKNIPKKYYRR